MKLKCIKSLVIGDMILIMKNDIIELGLGEEDKAGEMYYDIQVVTSQMSEGMEACVSIHKIAEHFEYLNTATQQSSLTIVK